MILNQPTFTIILRCRLISPMPSVSSSLTFNVRIPPNGRLAFPGQAHPVALGSSAGYVVRPPLIAYYGYIRASDAPRFHVYSRDVEGHYPSSFRGSPICSACPLTRPVCHTPAALETSYDYSVPSPVLLSSFPEGFSNRMIRTFSGQARSIEAAQFTLCCGPRHCSPCYAQDFYYRAFTAGVAT
jgi:hypothetical protein